VNTTATTHESKGIVGILGGMGPLATIDFMRKMLDATPARNDQDHVPVVVSSVPQIPDRTAAFRGEGESPLDAMVASGRRLVRAGAALLVMPCNTAHLWFDELQQALGVPMLHLVDAALEDAVASVGAERRIGLLATDATLASGLYLNRRTPAGAAHDIHWQLPTADEMTRWVLPGIAAVKAGRLPEAGEPLTQAVLALQRRGAAAVVLGCTEIPLALDAAHVSLPLIDATASLARRAVAWSLGQQRLAGSTA
jgi:aspartate racemase